MQQQPVKLPAEGPERRVVAAGESQLRLVRSQWGDLEVCLHHREQLDGAGRRPPELHNERLSADSDVADTVSYTHLRAHETDSYLVCRLLLEKKKKTTIHQKKK